MKRQNKLSSVTVCAVILAVLIAIGAALLPSYSMSFDTTKNKNYTITPEGLAFMDTLERDTTIYIVGADGSDMMMEYYFERFCDASKKLDLKFIELDDSEFLSNYGLTSEIEPYTFVIESDLRYTVLNYSDMMVYSNAALGFECIPASEYTYYLNYYQYYYQILSSQGADTSEIVDVIYSLMYGTTPYFVGETTMLEACEYVCMEKIPQILFTDGNGEPTGEDSPLVEVFGAGNRVDLSKIDSLTWKDASCLVINAPAEDFNDSETKIVLDFLKSGGRLLVITNEDNLTMPNLCKILSTYGLSSKGGVVYEGEGEEKTDSVGVAINYDHDSMVAAQQAGLVPEITGANPITLFTSADGALITVPLLMTSENSYVGEDVSGKGIKVVAAAAEEAVGKETVRIAWFTGANSFNSAELDSSVAESNVYTLFCAMNWLNRAYDSQVPSEIPVLYDQGALNVSSGGAVAVAIVFVLILPAGFVAISVVGRYKRKNIK